MMFKPVAVAPSDVPLQAPFANGFAILSQTKPYVSRRLTWCYASIAALVTLLFTIGANANNNATLIGDTELGFKFEIIEADWPVMFRCTELPRFGSFEIRRSIKPLKKAGNAWIVFENQLGYLGILDSEGSHWSFYWIDRKTEEQHTLRIGENRTYYFDREVFTSEDEDAQPHKLSCENVVPRNA